ncbi:MAG: hypothetical protein E6R03_06745 [Hyphomicrobiaceae bacterium]|nr:MAG: hypothetical protein E6R03_06745 [Hyphomicrobiaceae bacterium]
MKFSLISDMHVDFPQPKTPYYLLEQNVVVAGDTANGLEGLKFLQKLRNKGFNVYACDGNHEHYSNISQGRDVAETTARFREDHPSHGTIEGIPIILRNGWYPVTMEDSWKFMMNDSYRCDVKSATEMNILSVNAVHYVQQALEDWKRWQLKGIVVTHTSPCEETLNPKYEGDISNEWYWNPGMRSLLSEYSDQIYVWCHGHTHASNEAIVDGVRVICNPRGYPGENPTWAPKTIEINT